MIYFDTDVLINSIVIQNADKHDHAVRKIEDSMSENSFIISSVSIQELIFVLGKLKLDSEVIRKTFDFYSVLAIYGLDKEIFKRAFDLAEKISFVNINDALHLACAEKYADRIVTFNRDDFKKLKKHTKVSVEILD